MPIYSVIHNKTLNLKARSVLTFKTSAPDFLPNKPKDVPVNHCICLNQEVSKMPEQNLNFLFTQAISTLSHILTLVLVEIDSTLLHAVQWYHRFIAA